MAEENVTQSEHDKRPLYLKWVTLMDVVPGRADAPGVGEPIAIVTFEHKQEIEQPIMLNIRDTKKLAVTLLAVLAHHGDEKAKTIIAQHFTDPDDEDETEDDE